MGWSSQWMPVWRVWARLSVANGAKARDTCSKKAASPIHSKILTYGPNNDVLIDQIGPFIHIYFRRTILSGPRSIKSSLSRGDNFIFLIFQKRNLVAFIEQAVKIRITQLWCSLQRFKMNFKNIHLPIAYSGINRREIFQNSDLIGMNREDYNLVSSKKRRVSHLEKWIARGYHPKLLKFSLLSSGSARASLRITFLANPYWHIWLWPTIFTYLGKNDVSFFRKIP